MLVDCNQKTPAEGGFDRALRGSGLLELLQLLELLVSPAQAHY
jgi:hypothetical protein